LFIPTISISKYFPVPTASINGVQVYFFNQKQLLMVFRDKIYNALYNEENHEALWFNITDKE